MTKEELKDILIKNSKNINPPKLMPSKIQMAKNLAKTTVETIKSVAVGNSLNVQNEEAEKRKKICESCNFYNTPQQRCTKCGCYMAIKTYLKAASCPVGKW